jgi:hypothetical protein
LRKTAGELSLKASQDKTKYDLLEVGHELCKDVLGQLYICAHKHCPIFDMDEFCVILVVAGDPLIKGVRRHKYYAFPFLPMPRPQQSVFLYNKAFDSFKRLWSLPDAKVMAIISEMNYVSKQWEKTKSWCDAFYRHDFYDVIRRQNNISVPTESEFLNAHREELIQAGCKEIDSSFSEPFDFSKIAIEKIIGTKKAFSQEDGLNCFREAKGLDGDVASHVL